MEEARNKRKHNLLLMSDFDILTKLLGYSPQEARKLQEKEMQKKLKKLNKQEE